MITAMKNSLEQPTLASEAIRAYFTLQCCWLNDEEVYLLQGCPHCGAAATYLIYFTNLKIQKLLLNFIAQYRCAFNPTFDVLDLPEFEQHYNVFLQELEYEVNRYACQHQALTRGQAFEEIESIFDRSAAIAC